VHDEEQKPLQAVEDGEHVVHGDALELEAAEDPHAAQDTQLGHGGDGERSAGRHREPLIWSTLTHVDGGVKGHEVQQHSTHLILCRLSRSGFKVDNFWASFHTVIRKKKMFTCKSTGHHSIIIIIVIIIIIILHSSG